MEKLRYVSSFIDRHGRRRFRFRRTGTATHYFQSPPDTPEFASEYERCLAGRPPRARKPGQAVKIGVQSARTRRLAATYEGAESFIYFIGAKRGPIKIGFARVPHRRLKDIQSASPYELEMLALIPGTKADEAEIHGRLADCRLRGEWFERTDAVLEEISRAQSIG